MRRKGNNPAFLTIVCLCGAGLVACGRGPASDRGARLPYRDPGLSIDRRIEDLVARMTAEEKFRQLFMVPGDLGAGRDIWKDGVFGLQVRGDADARASAEKINGIQRFFTEETRLGIPIIPFEEALHGRSCWREVYSDRARPGSGPASGGLARGDERMLCHRSAANVKLPAWIVSVEGK